MLTSTRYWTDDSFSKLDGRGEFVAGKFANFSTSGGDAPPLPTLKDFKYFWHDVGAHMNRTYSVNVASQICLLC